MYNEVTKKCESNVPSPRSSSDLNLWPYSERQPDNRCVTHMHRIGMLEKSVPLCGCKHAIHYKLDTNGNVCKERPLGENRWSCSDGLAWKAAAAQRKWNQVSNFRSLIISIQSNDKSYYNVFIHLLYDNTIFQTDCTVYSNLCFDFTIHTLACAIMFSHVLNVKALSHKIDPSSTTP